MIKGLVIIDSGILANRYFITWTRCIFLRGGLSPPYASSDYRVWLHLHGIRVKQNIVSFILQAWAKLDYFCFGFLQFQSFFSFLLSIWHRIALLIVQYDLFTVIDVWFVHWVWSRYRWSLTQVNMKWRSQISCLVSVEIILVSFYHKVCENWIDLLNLTEQL